VNLRLTRGDLEDARSEGRYHRQALLEWWNQDRVTQARILVVGAGALGNEILKLLALLGVGQVLVYDMDRVECSNLSRGVLFRDADAGAFKVEAAVARMRELNPEVTVVGRPENVVHKVGLGVFLWADVVISGVDNREARVFVNSACARTGRPWVDGAIESFSGIVRAFHPSRGACYECTMSAVDRKLLAERRSCALLARDVAAQGAVPTTVVESSIVAAYEVQEAMKLLHGQPALIGEGIHFDGLWNEVSRVRYPRRDECPGHESLDPVYPLGSGTDGVTIGELLNLAASRLGEGAVLDFSRDLVLELRCPECGRVEAGRAVLGEVGERRALCPHCGVHRIVDIASSAGRDGPIDLDRTPAELGVPPFDIVVARLGLENQEAWLFDADGAAVLGPLARGGLGGTR
jgi:adenylyltransferase/sulfurtransferase